MAPKAEPNVELNVVDLQDGTRRTAELTVSSAGNIETPSAVLADQGLLHLGWDWGEFGGGLALVKLADLSVLPVPTLTRWVRDTPVYGFSRVGKELWVHGGMLHMGSRAFIAVAGEPYDMKYQASDYDQPRLPGPVLPITNVVDGPADALTVLAYNGIWRTDRDFAHWRKIETLDLRYSNGRPDALGSYPAVTSAWMDAGGRLVFATRADGLCVRASD